MIRRREFITLLGGAAAICPVVARAQQTDRVRRIGVLAGLAESDPEQRLRLAAFQQGLADLGWIDGRNVHIEYRLTDDGERRRTYAAELVGRAPDVMLASSTQALSAMREATKTIPIVFALVADPVGGGFVQSLSRPDGNATGFASTEDVTSGKWLELLKELDGRIARVLVIRDPSDPATEGRLRAIETAAKPFKIQLVTSLVQNADDIERAINAFAQEGSGSAIVLPSHSTASQRDFIALLMARHRLPAIYAYRYFVLSGGLLSYGIDTVDLHRRAASYIDRVLRGAKPGDLPVQHPTKFELVINLKTAKALGLTVPPTLLARADEVIE
jgi:putative ABC transport system substrate-binding protein